MTTTIEITHWPCSKKYAEDPMMTHSAFRQLLGPDHLKGLNDVFGGIDLEKQYAFAVLNWDSVQDHMNFLADKERQLPFAGLFADAQKPDTNDVTMKHAIMSADAALRCLRAPLTEVARINVKAGASIEAVQAVLSKYVAYVERESTPPLAAVYGQEVGNPEELYLVVGWRSTEDQKVAGESDEVNALIEEMAGVGELESHTTILQEVAEA